MRLSELRENLKKHQEIFTLFSSLIKEPDWNYFKRINVDLETMNPLSIKETVKEIWKIDFKGKKEKRKKKKKKKKLGFFIVVLLGFFSSDILILGKISELWVFIFFGLI
jgi:uncharacterized radical SAM superfamily protein